MRSCHIALLPLENNLPNNCKTEIKWMEAASESVAAIGGPGLYNKVFNQNQNGIYCLELDELIPKAKYLKENIRERINIIESSHREVVVNSNLRKKLPDRIRLYEKIWEQRVALDQNLLQRFPEISDIGLIPT